MKNTCVVLCLLFLASSVLLAQEKTNVQWKCAKPSVQHSIPVGDHVAVLHVFHEFTVAGYVVAPEVKKLGAELKGNSDQSTSFDCTGTYTPRHNLGQAAPLRGGAGVRLFALLLARGRSGSMHYEIACG